MAMAKWLTPQTLYSLGLSSRLIAIAKFPYRRSFALNVVSLHPGIQRELATINYWRNPAME